ncbi:unnamed protein product [Commensalibacter communis]|uniref:hypothetical protein n=1 Tax=Commensalibacter communis TaxID=2972786 RepID=UPI0022FFB493|nr:hypothetical protein [Commensalibacter communis]CAI3946010.1 unnamed protein product [Commensalibacter communis]
MKQLITSICFLISLICSFTIYAQTAHDEVIQGPFKTDLYPGGKIYFEKINNEKIIDDCRNVAFMLEYKQDNHTITDQIDKYYENGACVEIASVFFAKIKNRNYIFVMQKWEISLRAAGVYSDIYEINAYTKNKEGKLVIDTDISSDPNFEGVDGIVDDDEHPRRYYKYKTAAAIKKYLKQKYQ